MYNNKIAMLLTVISIVVLPFVFVHIASDAYAQDIDEPPVAYQKKALIVITNPLTASRLAEPVILPIASILKEVPDFNRRFFRLRHATNLSFEPLDIPSQIRMIPGKDPDTDELVFQVDMAPSEVKMIELWYNPEGTGLPDYPLKTQAFDTWYRPGENLAWENEVIAYRSYGGIVDFFGKTFPHLRLHDLPPDSYHHERLWGIDPYMVGSTPGLGGVLVFEGETATKWYGTSTDREFSYQAYSGGPVVAGGVVMIKDKGRLLTNTFSLFSGRYENWVCSRIENGEATQKKGTRCIAPGMQKFENARIMVHEDAGIIAGWGSATGEYGTIGTALVWNPSDAYGIHDTEDGIFVKLRPSTENEVSYLSIAVWYRASAEQPVSPDAFMEHLKTLAQCFQNPVTIAIER